MLKTTQLVDVTAQVSLKSRLLLGNIPLNAQLNDSNSIPNNVVKQNSNQSIPPQPKPAPQEVQPSSNHSSESKRTSQTIQPKPVQDQTNDNLSKKVLGKQDILDQILAKVNQEFKVVAPVLTGAAFLEHGDYLCLVLEQSY